MFEATKPRKGCLWVLLAGTFGSVVTAVSLAAEVLA